MSDLSSPAQSYPSPDNSLSTPLSNFSSSNQPVDNQMDKKMDISESKEVEPPDKVNNLKPEEKEMKADISPKQEAADVTAK